MRFLVLAGLLLAGAMATTARAQTVRGRVIDPAGAPVAGVVVSLLDEAGAPVARVLTAEAGEFHLAAPRAGSFRLRTLRIGFAPVMTDPFVVGVGERAVRDVSLAGLAVRLDTVRTVGRGECREITARGAIAAFRMWEQVAAALQATELTASRGALGVVMVASRKFLAPNGTLQRQYVTLERGFSQKLWSTRHPSAVRDSGFAAQDRDGAVTYHVPDIGVLLSPDFLSSHCFRIGESRDTALIALAFRPVSSRRGLTEVEGALLLDRRSAELRRMEYRYVNLPEHHELGAPGGHVEFTRSAAGAWFISKWWIRMPVLESRTVVAASGQSTRRTEQQTYLAATQVEGASLALVTQGTDTLWATTSRTIAGVVLDSVSGLPVSGATVALRGTPRVTRSDAAGEFIFAGILPGEYQIEATRASPSGTIRAARHLRMLERDTSLSIMVPSGSVIRGRVMNAADGRPIAGALVTIGGRTLASDSLGRFLVTGLDSGGYEIEARTIGFSPRTAAVRVGRNEGVRRDLVLERVRVLDTVAVTARNVIPSFEEHRKTGLGHFLTPEQLEKQGDRRLRDVIAQFPGVRILNGPGQTAVLYTSRIGRTSIMPQGRDRGDGRCYAQVYLDDVLIFGNRAGDEPVNLNQFATGNIEAIEFYPGAASTPLKYSTLESQCGVLVIHTRRARR